MKRFKKPLTIAAAVLAVLLVAAFARSRMIEARNMRTYFEMQDMMRKGASADEMEAFLKKNNLDPSPKQR